ncbi:TadE/TadG family type IV pilus assembly protein [Hyphococcus sp.]|jgi:Flp pilus assembly protein TadG|uniref:TadE/TadG family type IV pilus assembly protein n=1 Tax=Hyphococcus sp. TaxID=2038636 RepID=UPI003D0D197A
MMIRIRNSITRIRRNESGLAATEFALLLPILVMLFFGLVEASTAMTVNRKVAISANTLADLAAQSEFLLVSEMDDLFEGVKSIVEPNDSSGMSLKLVSIVTDPDGDPIVHWSRDSDGNTPYAVGSDYVKLNDPTVLSGISSLIVVEMQYTYHPSITNHVLSTPLNFDRMTMRWPRVSSKVQLCVAVDDCTS